jgi:hypothetical protein
VDCGSSRGLANVVRLMMIWMRLDLDVDKVSRVLYMANMNMMANEVCYTNLRSIGKSPGRLK